MPFCNKCGNKIEAGFYCKQCEEDKPEKLKEQIYYVIAVRGFEQPIVVNNVRYEVTTVRLLVYQCPRCGRTSKSRSLEPGACPKCQLTFGFKIRLGDWVLPIPISLDFDFKRV